MYHKKLNRKRITIKRNNFGSFFKGKNSLRKKILYLDFYNFLYLIVSPKWTLIICVNILQRRELDNTETCFTFYIFHKEVSYSLTCESFRNLCRGNF